MVDFYGRCTVAKYMPVQWILWECGWWGFIFWGKVHTYPTFFKWIHKQNLPKTSNPKQSHYVLLENGRTSKPKILIPHGDLPWSTVACGQILGKLCQNHAPQTKNSKNTHQNPHGCWDWKKNPACLQKQTNKSHLNNAAAGIFFPTWAPPWPKCSKHHGGRKLQEPPWPAAISGFSDVFGGHVFWRSVLVGQKVLENLNPYHPCKVYVASFYGQFR